ncbi:hypothetical protein [Pandoraea oxalativorans]|uniref:Uncharacterized protein n=1 Tax=Pandoraea oxalativorans TaxID=573737 RepID=A0A0G3ICB7_9BURK|nr:hypothetical protein [Pandoraea oxalativorans]AKK24829.1 hypothetical protein MB84_29055 [Pandoraea oxalativorans]
MRKFLRSLLTWNFWVDLPIVTRCPACEGSNSKLLSELSASRPEQWACWHCGETYEVPSRELNQAIAAMFSAYFGY